MVFCIEQFKLPRFGFAPRHAHAAIVRRVGPCSSDATLPAVVLLTSRADLSDAMRTQEQGSRVTRRFNFLRQRWRAAAALWFLSEKHAIFRT